MPSAQEAGQTTRGSTLIYHSKYIRSRTHFPATDTVWAYSRWPRLSAGLEAVLFPFTAMFICKYFNTKLPVLSRISLPKRGNYGIV